MIKKNSLKFLVLTCGILLVGSIIGVELTQKTSPDQTQSSDLSSAANEEHSVSALATQPLPPTQPTDLQSIHVSDPQALIKYNQGLKLYYQRQFPAALEIFDQALSIDHLCYEALNSKGATLAFQGKYDQGLALIQQALDLNPSFVYAHFNQGLANELAGRWDQAISSYLNALQLDDRDTWSYYGIASVYGRQGKIDEVLKYLQSAINLNSDVKEVARDEQDFLLVRKDPRFQALVKP